MNVRDLHVNDVRCQTRGCGAGPGENCNVGVIGVHVWYRGVPVHILRLNEYTELVEAGWQWQEVDPRDVNPGRK